jgi:hypothetical protein
LAEGVRTLYVAEQDSAGNWSAAGSFAVTLDLTAPGAPKMDSTPYSPLNTLKPTWTWKTGGSGNGTFRVRVDNPDMGGASMVSNASFTQPVELQEGKRTLYVQERDAAGNWSSTSSRDLILSKRQIFNTGYSFSSGLQLRINSVGNLILAIAGSDANNKLAVVKYSGSNWSPMPAPGLATDRVPGLAINSFDEVFVGGLDLSLNSRPSVLKNVNAAWQNVGGDPTIDTSYSQDFKLEIDKSNTLFSAYMSDSYHIKVRRNEGPSWEELAWRDTITANSFYHGISIAASPNGTPFLAVMDVSKLTVRKLQGITWQVLGNQEFARGGQNEVAMVVTSNNEPLVAIADGDSDNKATVLKFSSNAWSPLGKAGFSTSSVSRICLKLSGSGIPFVAFIEEIDGVKQITVMRFNGIAWDRVGSPVPVTSADYLTLAVDESGTPYVGYTDYSGSSAVRVLKASFEP